MEVSQNGKKIGCGKKGVQGALVATCGIELYCPDCQKEMDEKKREKYINLQFLKRGE